MKATIELKLDAPARVAICMESKANRTTASDLAPHRPYPQDSPMQRHLLMPGLAGSDHGRDVLALYTKNAAGNPAALGGRPLREDHSFCITSTLQEQAINHAHQSAKPLKVVLLERAPLAKEHAIRGGISMGLVLERRELKRADIVRKLEEAVVRRGYKPIDHDVLPEHISNCLMHGFRDNGLAVVVVNLHLVESLKVGQVVEQRCNEIPLYANEKLVRALRVKHLFIRQGYISELNALGKHGKTAEMALPYTNRQALVLPIASKQGSKMHGNAAESLVANKVVIPIESVTQVMTLLVENEGHEVIPGVAGIPRLVYEDGQLLHCCDLLVNKNAGGHPPALGGRPLREDHLFYTTGNALSSRCDYSKHMFGTQVITAGNKPASIKHRKAA